MNKSRSPNCDDYAVEEPGLERIGAAAISVVDQLAAAVEMASICESPIEVILGAYLSRRQLPAGCTLIPQFRWQRWRMDFAVVKDGVPILFIECDGKSFHSTRDQLENDAAKDRSAAISKIPMIRFTGREINRSGAECADAVLALL